MDTEPTPQPDKYQGLSPVELNTALRELLMQTFPDSKANPSFGREAPTDFWEMANIGADAAQRRGKSDLKHSVFRDLSLLLKYSKTTAGFQERVLFDLERIFKYSGIMWEDFNHPLNMDPRKRTDAPLRFILGIELLNPAGMFDPNEAANFELESTYYDMLKYKESLPYGLPKKGMAGLKQKVNKKIDNAFDYLGSRVLKENPEADIESRWKADFAVKYHTPLVRIHAPSVQKAT